MGESKYSSNNLYFWQKFRTLHNVPLVSLPLETFAQQPCWCYWTMKYKVQNETTVSGMTFIPSFLIIRKLILKLLERTNTQTQRHNASMYVARRLSVNLLKINVREIATFSRTITQSLGDGRQYSVHLGQRKEPHSIRPSASWPDVNSSAPSGRCCRLLHSLLILLAHVIWTAVWEISQNYQKILSFFI